jgi:hypothetical protein
MRIVLAGLALAALAFAADDGGWSKVRGLKGGTELRVIRKGAKAPLLVSFDEAFDDRLSVATKTEQISIPKEEIERIDYRPSGSKGPRMTKETKTTEQRGSDGVKPGPDSHPSAPSESYSTGASFGSGKPDFETIYRRPPTALPKPKP